MDLTSEIIALCRKEESAVRVRRNAARLARQYRQRRIALLAALDEKAAHGENAGGRAQEVKPRKANIAHRGGEGKAVRAVADALAQRLARRFTAWLSEEGR